MKTRIKILIAMFLFASSQLLVAQDIAVVYLQGEVKVYGSAEKPASAKKLVYGKLKSDKILQLSKGAAVRLLKNKGELCELKKAGTYKVIALKFIATKEESALSTLATYIVSFFSSHPSSESKEQYKNSIYAVSKGSTLTPVQEFPFEGFLPLKSDGLSFSWSTKCDTCKYRIIIKDFMDKKEILSVETDSNVLKISVPAKLFTPGKKYSWTITNLTHKLYSERQVFTIEDENAYNSAIKSTLLAVNCKRTKVASAAEFAAILGILEQKGQLNYAVLYSNEKLSKNSSNQELRDIFNSFYYDLLYKKNSGK